MMSTTLQDDAIRLLAKFFRSKYEDDLDSAFFEVDLDAEHARRLARVRSLTVVGPTHPDYNAASAALNEINEARGAQKDYRRAREASGRERITCRDLHDFVLGEQRQSKAAKEADHRALWDGIADREEKRSDAMRACPRGIPRNVEQRDGSAS